MTAKLIKYPENEWVVEVPEDNKGIKGSMMQGHFASTFGHGYKLSLKNCQAIERGYDLDELAHIRAEILNSYTSGTKWADEIDKSLTRYREVIELMGNKKFSEEDMNKAFRLGHSLQTDINLKKKEYKPSGQFFEEFIQSLQQTEWDVEIEMEYHPTFQIVKLDADGCLILTFKSE